MLAIFFSEPNDQRVLAFTQARSALSWVDLRKYRHCALELTDPASSTYFFSLETVINVADARLPVVPGICPAIFTRPRGNCTCASCVHGNIHELCQHYARCIEDQLCSKLCRHNIRTPSSAHHCSRHKTPLQLLQLRISREESKLHDYRDGSSTAALHRPSDSSLRPLQPAKTTPAKCQHVLINN